MKSIVVITAADEARAADPTAEFMSWPVCLAFLGQLFGRRPTRSTVYRWQNKWAFPKSRALMGGAYFSRKEVRRWAADRFAAPA